MNVREKLKKWTSPLLVRYTIVGTVATAVNYAFYWLFSVWFSVSNTQYWLAQIGTVWAANNIAWLISTVVAYLGNRFYVFCDHTRGFRLIRQIFDFFFWRWLSCAAETVLLNLMVTGWGFGDKWAKIIAITVSTALNYFTTKYFTFRRFRHKEKKEEE